MNLISIAAVYFSYILQTSSSVPILDTHIQPIAPFSLSPGNVNLETYWAEKYRAREGGDNLPVPVEQPNFNSESIPQNTNSPSSLPTIEQNNNDGNSGGDTVGVVLRRQRRSPQHHHHHHHHHQQPAYDPHYNGHYQSQGSHGHYQTHHNPHHHG